MMRWTAAVLLLFSSWLAGQDAGPGKSLAELARESREKRSYSKDVRVITNADLKALDANVSIASKSRQRPASEGADQAGQGEEKPEAALSEEELRELRGEFEDARNDLKMAVNEGLVLQLRMNQVRNAYLTRTDGTTQQRLQALMAETQQSIEQNKKAQEEARAAIRDLQSKARKAGLSPSRVDGLTGKLPEASAEIGTEESGSY